MTSTLFSTRSWAFPTCAQGELGSRVHAASGRREAWTGQPAQGCQVPLAEQADGLEIRSLEPSHCGEIHPLNAGLGDLPLRTG